MSVNLFVPGLLILGALIAFGAFVFLVGRGKDGQ